MTTEQVEEKVRETLHAVDLDRVRAPGDLVEKVVRRRGRRRFSQAAGAAVAVAAITVGAVFGFGGGGAAEQDRPVRPAVSPEGWKPWQSDTPGASERGCLVDGSALYCSGSKYDAAKIDANTGERLWTVKVNREGDSIDHAFAVRDGVVYAYRNHTAKNEPGGDYAGGTDLMAVDADTGDVLWKVQMPQDDRTDQAAMLIDGAVLANTPSLRTMSALDPLTGKEKWHHTWDKGIACQRAVLGGVPYLVCVRDSENPDHTDVFRLDPATGNATKVMTLPGGQQLFGTSGPSRTRLVLGGRRDAAGDVRLTSISVSGERTSHTYRIKEQLANADVVGDRVIAVSWKGKASAYSLTTGKTLWTAPVGVTMPDKAMLAGIASPAVSAGQGVVYFFSPTGDLSGLDLRTGERVWRGHVDLGKGTRDRGMTPQVLLYEDALVVRNGSRIVSLLPRIGN
ncbi:MULTISPECIES: PQQ-binding-like beta-propeller repeat protein [unclassified Streptomyces]|uniref:PQQ-binding-like beta-propeller repeat protein n=1 Tax=unclassified Streptomyces TaxID=2593676 RepID=UPI00225A16A5|nr:MULTISPECIES: PQQ-binding-like beta-propeller repeat protein [unclassified Streptomyces]MCX4987733.1 PQQ-like beta-propeller repeat protein [Streptomyces sp. NBC_00568]MCX5007134.1 PQQ-like beta-propeller repeat protein [Streptomyces sp. NBC_00638]